jgi:hypothetical protein
MAQKKSESYPVRFPNILLKAARRRAELDHTTVAEVIRMALANYLQEKKTQ